MNVDRRTDALRVLIIVGVRLYCEGLSEVLGHRPCIDVVGTATDPVRGLERERELRPDVVLVDTAMPDALTVVQAMLAARPTTRVVALGIAEEDQGVLAFAEAGVGGYVTRDATVDHLASVIESVDRGEMSCPPLLAGRLLRHISVLASRGSWTEQETRLTRRELEVVDLIDCGLSNQEIAHRLCIAVPTVKNHVHRILDKLQLRGRAEAAAWVRANDGQSLLRLRTSQGHRVQA